MKRNMKVLYASASALVLCGVFAGASTALAAGLKCECTNMDKCVLERGREDVPFSYDPNNMGGAYDAAEADAMRKADDRAADKGEAAYNKWSNAGLKCPGKCDPDPEIWWKHGKPFAGAGGTRPGYGEGRSVWKVSYICKETPQEDEEEEEESNAPNFDIGIGIGIGGDHDHYHHDHDRDHHEHDGDHHEHGGDHGDNHHDGNDKGDKHDHDKGDKDKDKNKDKDKEKDHKDDNDHKDHKDHKDH